MGLWDTIKGIGGALLPLAGPIGGVASTLIDASSQRATNAQNQRNIQQQEDFQDKESSTSYQRGVKDMEAAGLNPGLAYQQGGASTPTGGASTAQAPFQNTTSKFATALDTYNQLANGVAQRDLLREQTNATSADARLKQVQADAQTPEAMLSQQPDYFKNFLASRMAGLSQKRAESANYQTDFNAKLRNLNQQTATSAATAHNLSIQSQLNEQDLTNAWYRDNLAPYMNSTAHAAKSLQNFIPDMKINNYNIQRGRP